MAVTQVELLPCCEEALPNASSDAMVVLGNARDFMKQHGKWQGRAKAELANAVSEVVAQKRRSTSGTVSTLCISPANGSRLPCNVVEAKQSIVGDCQSMQGWTDVPAAKCKNEGLLLGPENLFLESLLAAVSVGDEDIVREVVRGAQPPRLEKVWATGDNVYVSGLDTTWRNFRIGDLLVFPDAVILNSGYPHSACWKYAVRAGDNPKDYINSKEGNALRMRGIKGSFLLPSPAAQSASIRTGHSVSIARKGTEQYNALVRECRPPLPEGTELVFTANGRQMRATANDTQAYIDLLVFAGIESSKIDTKRYSRTLPDIVLQEIGLMEKMDISEEAMSGDGTIENVGVMVDGEFQCPDCRQKFTSLRAQELHWKFIHDPNRHQED